MPSRRTQAAFTLVELAVVMAIIGLLLAGAMVTLTAQSEQRAIDETRRRLNAGVEALIAYAVVNGRLPCPAATGGTNGDESPAGGGACASPYNGFLPARTIGVQPTDDAAYALDAWNNRIRYAVSTGALATSCMSGAPLANHFTSTNLKTNGMSCRPSDLDVVCSTATSGTCTNTTRVVAQNTAAFIVYSVGRNGANTTTYGADETENINATATFVNRTWSGSDSPLGMYDDLMVVVPAGVLYTRLVAAGVLP